ncbi:MAG: serine/threonine protein kinase, partial [Zavarzinella sp.]|nr:serine/threonine protein kinase [Zavarzinella sp.]
SMGTVHAARPADSPAATVVVKVLRTEVADTARLRQSFDREVQYTARLRHPYIVRVLDAGFDPAAGPCIVMEFVPGTTLERVLAKERRLAPPRAGWLAGCLCHALEAAHARSVIHRDLKPANLMVVNAGTPQEHLKVMDFGLAHLASKPHLSKEQFERADYVRTQGTPAYMSPEQVRGDEVDGRADLYAAGVILYEALTGRLPFRQNDVHVLVEAHVRDAPPTFADVGAHDVPAELEQVVQWCLAKFAAERPASARALADELGKALGTDLWASTAPSVAAETQYPMPEAEPAVPVRPPGPAIEPNSLVRQLEAWMPDRIAVVKLGGCLEDLGGRVVDSQPGLVRARFAPPPGPKPKPPGLFALLFPPPPPPPGDGIALDLNLDKPNPNESRLVVTAVFRLPGGGRPKDPPTWAARCEQIYREMQKYLMAGR